MTQNVKRSGPAPWVQRKWLEDNASLVVQYARRHGTYAAQEQFGIKDYMTLHGLLERHKDIPSNSTPEQAVDDLLSTFYRFLHARERMIQMVSKET